MVFLYECYGPCSDSDFVLMYAVVVVVVVVVVIDRFYIALFSVLEQTHCARLCLYMSE